MYPIAVTTFYKFSELHLDQLEKIEQEFFSLSEDRAIKGLIISATEGLNATLSGSDSAIRSLKDYVKSIDGFSDTIFKDSRARKNPFKRFKIKRRDEIVTLKRPDVVPSDESTNHLSPKEWQQVLDSKEDVVLIDTRNTYEVEVGKFKGALDPKTDVFSDFGDFVDSANIQKEQKVLMYCTGGIRCEKAIYEMQERGYENVFQLDGGILNYLQEFPNTSFEGECFVFDHRVAVDQELKPSAQYGLCPHCGDPGKVKAVCPVCDKDCIVCSDCLTKSSGKTCSKNCSYHFTLTL